MQQCNRLAAITTSHSCTILYMLIETYVSEARLEYIYLQLYTIALLLRRYQMRDPTALNLCHGLALSARHLIFILSMPKHRVVTKSPVQSRHDSRTGIHQLDSTMGAGTQLLVINLKERRHVSCQLTR